MNFDPSKLNLTPGKIVAGVGVLAALFLLLILFVFLPNGVTNAGNKKQQELIQEYNQTTNVLNDCVVRTKQSVGVANANTAALDKVISDAVRGRYEGDSSAKPTGGALFSAISEAYPNTDKLSDVFNAVLVIINGCRSDFRDEQAKLQADVATFESWRTGSWTVRTFGGKNYPTDALRITVAGKPVIKQAALDQMRTLVVVAEAQSARDTGVDSTAGDPFAVPPAK